MITLPSLDRIKESLCFTEYQRKREVANVSGVLSNSDDFLSAERRLNFQTYVSERVVRCIHLSKEKVYQYSEKMYLAKNVDASQNLLSQSAITC